MWVQMLTGGIVSYQVKPRQPFSLLFGMLMYVVHDLLVPSPGAPDLSS